MDSTPSADAPLAPARLGPVVALIIARNASRMQPLPAATASNHRHPQRAVYWSPSSPAKTKSTVSATAPQSSSAANHRRTASSRSAVLIPPNSSDNVVLAIRATRSETSVCALSVTGYTPCTCRRTSATASLGRTSACSQQLARCSAVMLPHSSMMMFAASKRWA